MPKLMFLIASPLATSVGATWAAEKPICPSSGVSEGSPTAGILMPLKESRHTNGPSLDLVRREPSSKTKLLTRMPAMFRPQSFLKGADVVQVPRPKETEMPTSNCSSIVTGTALSSRKCGSSASASMPVMSALMRTCTLPLPSSCRNEPGITASFPTSRGECPWPMKTRPGMEDRILILYGFGFLQVTTMLSPTWIELTPSVNSSIVGSVFPHSVSVYTGVNLLYR
mmetsp:Transcript_36372/g.93780  ORF Transcript_36372/g.93780 Transcript_36372/m.93780 type:complete len:226 (+) Transcript_36372:795-1472(+)